MEHLTQIKNWRTGSDVSVLESIHEEDVNIVILERNSIALQESARKLKNESFSFKMSGEVASILTELNEALQSEGYDAIFSDIEQALVQFEKISEDTSFRLSLTSLTSDMCRKFHTDLNDLRLLCTYDGPGTLWLTEDNIDRSALQDRQEDDAVVRNESEIMQVATGDIVLLKGAIYPKQGTRAVVHRSPSIEEYGESRLLLRIDTNGLFNF